MNKKTERQRAELMILCGLCIVLVVVVVFQMIVMPLLNDCSELEEKISEQEFSLSLVKADIASNNAYESENATLNGAIKDLTNDLYNSLTTEEFDAIVTDNYLSCGLVPKSLKCETTVYETGIKIITAEYTADGAYSSWLDFVEMMGTAEAVSIDHIEMKALTDDSKAASADNMRFTFVLSAYIMTEVQ